MPDNTATLDGISLEIFRNLVQSVVDECFISLMKSSRSSNIKERRDHSVALFDTRGRLVAQAKESLPIHLGSLTGLIEKLVQPSLADTISEGDIFIANDPYKAGGTHLPDLNFAMPIFDQGRLLCFICNIAHHSDFGGMHPGSMAGGMTSIYQEGLRIPPIRLYKSNELASDVMSIILTNTRINSERKGDMLAQESACRLGNRRMLQVSREYGFPVVVQAFSDLIARTKQRMHKAIEELPDGEYEYEDMVDDDGISTRNIRLHVRIKISGQSLTLDFGESAAQVPGNVNCPSSATQSAIGYALKALLDPEVPNNQGAIDAIKWSAPKGSVLNAQYPAAVANRAQTVQRIVDVVMGALAPAVPDRVVAAANGANTTAVFSGINPLTQKQYVYLETLGGGFGGRATKDGKDGVQVHITNTSNLPVEVIETEYPLFVESYGFVVDSGGAGCYRGGLGLRRVISPIGHTCSFSGAGERFENRPWGLFGGVAGQAGRFCKRQTNGDLIRLPNKPGGIECESEEAIVLETPGAGGYGAPEKRALDAIQNDQESGKFSQRFIASEYQRET